MADTVVEIIEQPTRVRVEGGELIIEATQGILRVADALDVDLAGRVDGDVLTWDSATGKYVHDPAAGGGDLTDAVILAPATSARNVIQPTDPDAIGLTIRAPVGSFENETWIIRIEDEFGNIRTQIDTVGDYDIRLNDDVNFPGVFKILAGVHGYPIFLSQESGHLFRLFVGKKLSVVDSTNLNELFAIDEATGQVTIATSPLLLGSTAINFGTGSPEGAVAAPVGSLYLRSDGAGGTTLYVKESGAGDTGWTAISAGGSGAPTTATYITQTPDAGLSAEQALSALATGLVKNTTGTGVLSIGAQGTDYWAPGGTDVAVADGGTGASTAAGARTNLGVIAANVPFTPAGTIAATDVQAAIEEVASEAGGGGISPTLFDANTVLAADTDDTPAALTMGASTILARLAAGNIVAATPAQINTLLGWTTVTKASDESVTSSTTVQADDELFFTAVSGAFYEVEICLIYASPAGAGTPDFKVALGEDNTNRGGVLTFTILNASDVAASTALTAVRNNPTAIGTAAANRLLLAKGHYGGGGGTFAVMWAQQTSDANATTVRAGSLLRYKRIL